MTVATKQKKLLLDISGLDQIESMYNQSENEVCHTGRAPVRLVSLHWMHPQPHPCKTTAIMPAASRTPLAKACEACKTTTRFVSTKDIQNDVRGFGTTVNDCNSAAMQTERILVAKLA